VMTRDHAPVSVTTLFGSGTLLVQVGLKQPSGELGIEAVRIRPDRTSAS
jgi:hypothetical protein